jgi:hypothetical protein
MGRKGRLSLYPFALWKDEKTGLPQTYPQAEAWIEKRIIIRIKE